MQIHGAGAGPHWPESARGAAKSSAARPTTEVAPPSTAPVEPAAEHAPVANGVRRLLDAGHFNDRSNFEMLNEKFGTPPAPPVEEVPPVDPGVLDPPLDEVPPAVDPAPADPPVEPAPAEDILPPPPETSLEASLLELIEDTTTEEPAAA